MITQPDSSHYPPLLETDKYVHDHAGKKKVAKTLMTKVNISFC